ncbi:MAG: thioredoxin family protein [Candidatus Hydrogenedentes bacterium]|nr:thioredoxin family protein [Candidatus Hydrogenedentota bacterium]
MKNAIFLLLLAGGLAVLACSETPAASAPEAKKESAAAPATPVLVVYYFHRTLRCPSCLTIEEWTKRAVNDGFPVELESGRIALKVSNLDEPGNAHFDKDYRLNTQSVVLSDTRDGRETRWKNLEEVWELLDDEVKFLEYIRAEIREFLAETGAGNAASPAAPAGSAPVKAEAAAGTTAGLPTLMELGADKCVPCRAMVPVLDALRKEYPGRLNVQFIDVWKNPEEGKKHRIRMIPVQLFLDADGKELFRHEGFYAKEDILAKWKELAVDLDAKK